MPVVFHSSNDEDALRRTVVHMGAAGYVCKGDLQDLLRKLRKRARP